MLAIDHLDVLSVSRGTSITMDLEPEDLEMALATNGMSLQHAVMMAIVSALTIDHDVELNLLAAST